MAAGRSASAPPRTSVWLDDRPTPRRSARSGGEQSGLDLARITEASVALLDAEGMAKFSMRRLAGELGVTAMSLYWYVGSKDELLEFALDAVQGELDVPADLDADWRAGVRHLAAAYRAMLVDHPWVSQTNGQYLNIGPGAMRFARAAQGVLRSAGLPPERLAGAMAAVFQFAYGFGTVEANWNARCAHAGLEDDEFYGLVLDKVSGRPEYEESLQLRDMASTGTVRQMRQHDFDTALDLLIAGIETMRAAPLDDSANAPGPTAPSAEAANSGSAANSLSVNES